MAKRKRYYSKKNSISASEVIVIIALMYSTKYVKNESYSKLIIGLGLVIILGLIISKSIKLYKKHKKEKQYLNSRIRDIDNMTGIEFEELLKVHFKSHGYKVSLTPASNDYGADLVLVKDEIKTVVQAKRYNSKIGNKAVQEVIGAMGYYQANKGMVVTNSFFTSNAITLANANGIELWNRNKLIEKFQI